FTKETNQVETGYDRKVSEHIFKSFAVIPSYFDAVEEVDTTVDLFGHRLSFPIIPAPMSRLTNITDKPIVKLAQAAKTLGTLTTLGISSEEMLTEVADVGVPAIKIIKPYRDFEKMKSMVKAAQQNKMTAVGVDMDYSFGKKNGDQIFLAEAFSPKSTAQIRELVEMVEIPFVIKGSLSKKDALIAKEIGCSGLLITNHGNTTIDYAVQPLEVLPKIREAVGPEMKIIIDGGIRRGSDIFKCLALGADAVCIGRMAWMGLIVDEVNGVIEIFNILNDELKRYMCSTGATRLKDINPTMVMKRDYILP
ncbi:MAG: hypothetical protein CVU87_06895, partial [Firmicutes bacterium HGW-Firmicutes-12]